MRWLVSRPIVALLTFGRSLISFEDYQVGPHSMGQPKIIVPYTVLRGLLSPHSSVAPLIEQ